MDSAVSSKSVRVWQDFSPTLDQHLPKWARRSNPVVRRHLGVHWKVLPLETGLLLRLLWIQGALILASLPLPIILPLVFTMLPVALVLLPFVFFAYGRTLIQVGIFTTRMIVEEQHNNTLSLLRTTPISLSHILYSKAAAGVWRQIEDLGLIVMGAAVLTLPAIGLQYATYWPFDEISILSRITLAFGLLTSLARLLLEPVMIAAMAILVGATVPVRTPALVGLGGFGFFYFLLTNLPRLLPLSIEMRLIVEFVVPLVLPILITFIAFRLAVTILKQE